MRTYLIMIYVILYITHIILGPYYYRFMLKGQRPKYISNTISDILKKSVYITYISMLYTIYFLIKLDTESYICALSMTLISLITYIIKYGGKGRFFSASAFDHTLLIIPFIFYKSYYNINIEMYNPGMLSYLTMIILIIYAFTHKQIYL